MHPCVPDVHMSCNISGMYFTDEARFLHVPLKALRFFMEADEVRGKEAHIPRA